MNAWSKRLIAVALGAMAGCSGGKAGTPTFPVEGRVEYQGKAATGAFVVFHPTQEQGGEVRPTGKVGEDGKFQLTSFDDLDGAPAGEYAVTVEWYKLVNKGSDWQRGPNVIPPKYGKADTTPIRVTIREGSNTLEPFQIVR
ncbi:MAG: hypothetical protein U0800_04685 [Isosphaeraceae bacterium]